MTLPSYRQTNLALFFFALMGMVFALYMQHGQGFEPCPLCVFQRIGLIALGMVALLAFLVNPKGAVMRRIFAFLSLLGIGWSVGVAARHVWLQHLPADQVPSCGPGLEYWLDALPFLQVLKEVLSGSGECAKIDATFLSFSIPEWSLAFFIFLALIVLWQLVRPVQKPSIFV